MSQTVLAGNLFDQKTGNLLANGGFENWVLGTSFVSPADAAFVADGWAVSRTSPDATITREAGAGNFDTGGYSMKINITSVGAGVYRVKQLLDGPTYAGKTVSISARVKTSLAGVKVSIQDTNGTTLSVAHSGSGAWETLKISRSCAVGITFLQAGIGWYDVNVPGTGAVYIDSVILIVGNIPIDYIPENPEIDKVKAGSLSALQLNQYNLLDNGGFGSGQKYTGIVFGPVTPGLTVVDRWKVLTQTSGTQPTYSYQVAADGNQAHAIRYNCTVVGTGSITDSRFAYQALDTGISILEFRGKQLSLSMWMKSNSATAGVQLQYGSGLFAYAYHSGGGAWEYLTVTVTVDAAATIITVGAFVSPLVTCDVWINDAMLVVGSTPVPYYQLPPAVDMMRCQRYCQVIGAENAGSSLLVGQAYSTASAWFPWRFPVQMAATPAMTVVGGTLFKVSNATLSVFAAGVTGATPESVRGGFIACTGVSGSPLLQGNACGLYASTTGAYVIAEVA